MADEELELDVTESKGSKKTIIIIVIAFLLINGIGIGAWLFMSSGADSASNDQASNSAKEQSPSGPLHYLTMVPEFIVNFGPKSKVRYLQVDLQIATRSEAALTTVNTYRPQIRNDILILLSDVNYDELKDRPGKESLQKRLLDVINSVVSTAENGKAETKANNSKDSDMSVEGPIENVYFTSFIMQ